MNTNVTKIGQVKISSGQQTSNVITSKEASYDAEAILLIAPAALDAGTYTIEVGDTRDNAAGTNFATLQDETATDYSVPAAGKAIVYSLPCWPCWRIKCSVVAGADRIFTAYKVDRAGC